MLFTVAADDRAAMQFDDVASALDAGVSIASLGGDTDAGERSVQTILEQRGVRLTTAEDTMLAAAWSSGRLVAALRARADQRRQRADFGRELRKGLRYPLLVLALAMFLSLVLSTLFGPWIVILGATLLGGLVFLTWWLRRQLTTGDDRWLRLPWLGPLAAALGELPYLETMLGLYSAGVPVTEAHERATGAVSVASLRLRLRAAERTLRDGRNLREGLASADALLPETRDLLATGEAAGQLEEALGRALRRRRETTARDLQTTVRWAGGLAYGTAVVVALIFIMGVLNQLSSLSALTR
ncbi:MAG: type II secretion system F family protein [bacterium]|nr:type II secretion system F family protein [bacterium]